MTLDFYPKTQKKYNQFQLQLDEFCQQISTFVFNRQRLRAAEFQIPHHQQYSDAACEAANNHTKLN